jgi:hypothetical protein
MDPVASRRVSRRISIADLLAFTALIDSMNFLMRTGPVCSLSRQDRYPDLGNRSAVDRVSYAREER